jgi:ABC transporter substrate binding protein
LWSARPGRINLRTKLTSTAILLQSLVPSALQLAGDEPIGRINCIVLPNVGLLVLGGSLAAVHRDLIIALAARYRLPAIYAGSTFPRSGGLLSYGEYGIERIDNYRKAAEYVDRILRGEKPADLPVQAPTKYELVINLKTAKALGLTVPLALQVQADEVIE